MTQLPPPRVSVHGGHSGPFCLHAKDTLEDIVQAYIAQGFSWVGLTEHMTPNQDAFALPEEASAGMTVADHYARFTDYFVEARRLQQVYASQVKLYVGFETECTTGYVDWIDHLRRVFQPDYLVGSVHHVQDVLFDSSLEDYQAAARKCGGMDLLYCVYFDQQHELLTTLKPEVVGHFDVIRVFDRDYAVRLLKPDIWRRIQRNLDVVKELGLILDFNLRALSKGQPEPYISRPILTRAFEMGIAVVPGDDSHGVTSVGANWDQGMQVLREVGFTTNWRRPA